MEVKKKELKKHKLKWELFKLNWDLLVIVVFSIDRIPYEALEYLNSLF